MAFVLIDIDTENNLPSLVLTSKHFDSFIVRPPRLIWILRFYIQLKALRRSNKEGEIDV